MQENLMTASSSFMAHETFKTFILTKSYPGCRSLALQCSMNYHRPSSGTSDDDPNNPFSTTQRNSRHNTGRSRDTPSPSTDFRAGRGRDNPDLKRNSTFNSNNESKEYSKAVGSGQAKRSGNPRNGRRFPVTEYNASVPSSSHMGNGVHKPMDSINGNHLQTYGNCSYTYTNRSSSRNNDAGGSRNAVNLPSPNLPIVTAELGHPPGPDPPINIDRMLKFSDTGPSDIVTAVKKNVLRSNVDPYQQFGVRLKSYFSGDTPNPYITQHTQRTQPSETQPSETQPSETATSFTYGMPTSGVRNDMKNQISNMSSESGSFRDAPVENCSSSGNGACDRVGVLRSSNTISELGASMGNLMGAFDGGYSANYGGVVSASPGHGALRNATPNPVFGNANPNNYGAVGTVLNPPYVANAPNQFANPRNTIASLGTSGKSPPEREPFRNLTPRGRVESPSDAGYVASSTRDTSVCICSRSDVGIFCTTCRKSICINCHSRHAQAHMIEYFHASMFRDPTSGEPSTLNTTGCFDHPFIPRFKTCQVCLRHLCYLCCRNHVCKHSRSHVSETVNYADACRMQIDQIVRLSHEVTESERNTRKDLEEYGIRIISLLRNRMSFIVGQAQMISRDHRERLMQSLNNGMEHYMRQSGELLPASTNSASKKFSLPELGQTTLSLAPLGTLGIQTMGRISSGVCPQNCYMSAPVNRARPNATVLCVKLLNHNFDSVIRPEEDAIRVEIILVHPNNKSDRLSVKRSGDGLCVVNLCSLADGSYTVYFNIGTEAGANNPFSFTIRNGQMLRTLTILGSFGMGDGEFCRPWGIAYSLKNRMYLIADRNNDKIHCFHSNCKFAFAFGTPGTGDGELKRPAGIAADFQGNIYVCDKDNHRIQKFDEHGKFLMSKGLQGSNNDQFNYPWDISVGKCGRVAVTDTRNHRVTILDTDLEFIESLGQGGSTRVHQLNKLESPRGVAFTNTGRLVITDFNNHRVIFLDPATKQCKSYGDEGSGVLQMRRPQGVACDFKNNVVVVDSRNERLIVFNESNPTDWRYISIARPESSSTSPSPNPNAHNDRPGGVVITPDGTVAVVHALHHHVQLYHHQL